MFAELIVRNAKITTLDRENPDAEALAIKDGVFIEVGRADALMRLANERTRLIDAGGRRIIPGLNDSHTHLIRGGLNYNLELRWEGVESVQDALALLKAQAAVTPPPQWVRVVGSFTMFQFKEQRLPTLEEINAAAPDTPVFILHLYDRALLNRAALRAVGYDRDTPAPPGGEIERDAKGEPTGLLLAKPNAMILYATLAKGPRLEPQDQINSTRHFMRELNRLATGFMTPALLLALTAAGGVSAALMGPPWQSIVPELVPKPLLRQAVALNSLGINIARAIGPAIGGLVIAVFGVALAYWLDAVSYLFVIAALLAWKRQPASPHLAPERFLPAMATGVGYVLRSDEVKRVLLRAAIFFLFASAYWALLPLIARESLDGGASLYGALLAAIGAGAVTGALILPRIKISPDLLVLLGTLATAGAMATLALARIEAAAAAALFVAGAAWIAVLTTLNVTAQAVLPNWVRARGLAVYITAFFGAMTAGSALWGVAANEFGVAAALLAASAGGGALGLLAMRIPLPKGEADLTPSMHWPEPATAEDVPGERGPIMVQIAYRIAPENRTAFLEAIAALSTQRLRDGGFGWRVFENAEDPQAFTEIFFAPSWLDHLRQHERVTKADQALQEAVNRFHQGLEPPKVAHHLAAAPGDAPGQALALAHRDIA